MLPTFPSSFITVYSPRCRDWHFTGIHCHKNSKHTQKQRKDKLKPQGTGCRCCNHITYYALKTSGHILSRGIYSTCFLENSSCCTSKFCQSLKPLIYLVLSQCTLKPTTIPPVQINFRFIITFYFKHQH